MLDWGWLGDHVPALLFRTGQHLYMTAIAVAAGLLISLAAGIFASRARVLATPFGVVAGIVYTIPSLALFSTLVLTPLGLSVITAEIPLTLYTLVILYRNVLAGLDSVAPDVREAADAMSYRGSQRLVQVELPLAVPLIVAGVRVAVVSTIGLVTVSALLGDALGGLGYFIYDGARKSPPFTTEILAGAVPTILLALVLDRVFVWLQARLTPWEARSAARSAA